MTQITRSTHTSPHKTYCLPSRELLHGADAKERLRDALESARVKEQDLAAFQDQVDKVSAALGHGCTSVSTNVYCAFAHYNFSVGDWVGG